MSDLKREIAAFDGMRSDLEIREIGKWAVVHDEQLVGTYDSFDDAAVDAVGRFGRGPFLIRQVGAVPVLRGTPKRFALAGYPVRGRQVPNRASIPIRPARQTLLDA